MKRKIVTVSITSLMEFSSSAAGSDVSHIEWLESRLHLQPSHLNGVFVVLVVAKVVYNH